jgi:hypothetical protein
MKTHHGSTESRRTIGIVEAGSDKSSEDLRVSVPPWCVLRLRRASA